MSQDPILVDYSLDGFIFKEPIQLFYTDGTGPLSREVKTMEDVADLLEEIRDNHWPNGIGLYTIEMQLWFALARKTKFFKQN